MEIIDMKKTNAGSIVLLAWFGVHAASAALTVGTTTVLGSFAGVGAPLSANQSPIPIQFYGTDLGFTYTSGGKVQILFGDSWRNESNQPIGNPSPTSPAQAGDNDDAFGTIDLGVYSSPNVFSPMFIPVIKYAQDPGTGFASGSNPARPMDLGKTPLGGFSNGTREFGWFTTTKPLACATTSDCTAVASGLTCDTGLGFFNATAANPRGFTGGCVDGQFGCLNDTKADAFGFPIPGTGFCRDATSTVYANTPAGRLSAVAAKLVIGIRSTTDNRVYTNTHEILTGKFQNSALATVQSFVPANGSTQDYSIAISSGAQQRVLLWGRPAFIGVNAKSRTNGLYFAYADMPTGEPFTWTMQYYKGTVASIPQFSTNQADAVALDLDSTSSGIQTTESNDVVNQMSVVWVSQLNKWVMFYGGGMSNLPTAQFATCGVLELFTGPDCTSVVLGNGAIRMRTADNPWGPWTPP
jgi:hypothetical protein